MHVLIVGAGLSGLALADALGGQGVPFTLVEARPRTGGRVLTQPSGRARFDMGPAWFWQGQPRMAALAQRFGIDVFEQYASGDLIFEDAEGRVQRGRGFASMEGSLRLCGGMSALTDALAQSLPADCLRLGTQVTSVRRTDRGVSASLSNGDEIDATHVVLAMPPRLAAEIRFDPPLPDMVLSTMRNVSTWMAGQSKAVAVYDRPHWREAGLSGDASSRRGPMVEIHDASPPANGPYALFGFIGVPPHLRRDKAELRDQIVAQFVRLFGEQAGAPRDLFLKDWADDPLTAAAADSRPLTAHPAYGMPDAMRDLWEGRLLFAGTETAARFGGYLEGALEAAEAAAHKLAQPQGEVS